MPLRSRTLKFDARVCKAAENNPPFFMGEAGNGVRTLQIGLIRIGYKMPISQPPGAQTPDGIYGDETASVVRQFQQKQHLDVDGIAGHDTLYALDAMLANEIKRPDKGGGKPDDGKPDAGQPGGQPGGGAPGGGGDPDFKPGSDDPPKGGDPGAGPWRSHWPTPDMIAARAAMMHPAFQTAAIAAIGDDAARNLRHYLNISGDDLTIDFEGLVRETPSAGRKYTTLVDLMALYVETLGPGVFQFTSRRSWTGYCMQSECRNWYFAQGGHQVWIKGTARVLDNGDCFVAAEYKFRDRYNWDGGKSVTIYGVRITDEFMGELHRQGLAREYDCQGAFRRNFHWRKGYPIPPGQLGL
ncbi:MAG: peptidoglycan-binding protein [Rhizobiales bacterium]|nr:peptidoglycan-binding protein [Hyphomicrobiales bacterium]